MKKLSESEVKKIVKEHEQWLKTDGEKGKQANFSDTNLRGMDFHGCDLRNARFDHSDLTDANFQNAKLYGAILFHTVLTNTDFRGSDLTYADFDDAYADKMIYDETTICFPMACPEEGAFIGYKKAYGIWSEVAFIVKLRIPEDAKRSSATRNVCRCSKAEVLSITYPDGTKADETEVRSRCYPSFVYRLGETIEVSDFDECKWHECAPGIHFFMDREDAVEW